MARLRTGPFRPGQRAAGRRRTGRSLRQLAAGLRTGAAGADAVVQPRPQPAVAWRYRSGDRGPAARARAGAGLLARLGPARRCAGACRPFRRSGCALPRRAGAASGLRRRLARAGEHEDAAAVRARPRATGDSLAPAWTRRRRPHRDGFRAGQGVRRPGPLRAGLRRTEPGQRRTAPAPSMERRRVPCACRCPVRRFGPAAGSGGPDPGS